MRFLFWKSIHELRVLRRFFFFNAIQHYNGFPAPYRESSKYPSPDTLHVSCKVDISGLTPKHGLKDALHFGGALPQKPFEMFQIYDFRCLRIGRFEVRAAVTINQHCTWHLEQTASVYMKVECFLREECITFFVDVTFAATVLSKTWCFTSYKLRYDNNLVANYTLLSFSQQYVEINTSVCLRLK